MRKTKIALAFCLITALLISPLAAMDDHGRNVVVTREDGTLAQGELLAVKRNALVVSAGETSTGQSISIAIEDIREVDVSKKSNALKGTLWGALVGGGIGTLGGLFVSAASYSRDWGRFVSASDGAIYGLIIGGVLGVSIGAAISSGGNETFRFDFSKEDREAALLQLSEYAAIKGVR